MKLGTPYWAIEVNSYELKKQELPRPEYLKLIKQLQFDLKHYSKGKLKFKTEAEASEVFSKLPKFIQAATYIAELTPVYGII